MLVQSPVGTFPVRITRATLRGGVPRVETTMGAWRSQVTLERADLRMLLGGLAVLAISFAMGRLTGSRS
jgi:hypothetical protein